jgi:hypothetical protein
MKNYVRILAAIAFLAGCGIAANAQMQDNIIAKVPFQFIVNGKTLPAGTYTVRHLSDNTSGPLILTNRDNGSSVFVNAYLGDYVSAGKPVVSFQQVGEQRFLSTIQTPFDIYQIPASRSAIMEAAAKLRSSGMSSGGSGSE